MYRVGNESLASRVFSYFDKLICLFDNVLYVYIGSVHGPRRCWIPVMSNQLSNTTTAYTSMDGFSADEERELMLPPGGRPDDIPLYRLDGQQTMALIPVIVPVAGVVGLQLNAVATGPGHQPQRTGSLRRLSSNASSNREVKFDETVL